MADFDDLFLVGEDFDAFLEILEDEEDLEAEFSEAVDSVQSDDGIKCELCQKMCKSKAGLKRHHTAKHKPAVDNDDNDYTLEDFKSVVTKAILKITDHKIYPLSIRDELRMYCSTLKDVSIGIVEIKAIYKGLLKSGNAERFYTNFYTTIVLNATTTFQGLSEKAATLLSTKVADCMVAQRKEKTETVSPSTTCKLSDKEMAGLQYIGGYVLHKLFNKLNTNHNPNSQQCAAILKAGKSEKESDVDSHKLTSSLNRGGLWVISKHAQLIFFRIEHHFRIVTSETTRNIDISSIESRSVCDLQLVSAYNAMLSDSELIVDNSIAKDVLHNIVYLYVKVRSFSFAKDVVQKHKVRCKQMKAKALRKDISRSSAELEYERQV